MADEAKVEIGRIELDKETCIGAASCVAVAPGTFELGEDGKVQMKDAHGEADAVILEAAKSCPVNAIKIFDKQGNQIYPKQ